MMRGNMLLMCLTLSSIILVVHQATALYLTHPVGMCEMDSKAEVTFHMRNDVNNFKNQLIKEQNCLKKYFQLMCSTPKQEFLSSVRLLQEYTNDRVDESKFIMNPHKTVVMRCPDNPDCCNEKTHDRNITLQSLRFVYAVRDITVGKQTHNFRVVYVDNHVKCECIKKHKLL